MIPPIGQPLAAFAAGLSPLAVDPAAQPAATRVPGADDAQSAGSATTGQGKADPGVPSQPSSLEKALESVNTSLQAWSTGMRFEMDEDAQRLVVSIVDSESGEVLRTIPSDAVLRVARMIVQLQGAGIDARA